PFQAAFVHAFDALAGDSHHRYRRLHTCGVLHLPHQLVHGCERVVMGTAFGGGLDHDHQHIGAGRIVVDDEIVVLVIARIGTQFRSTLIEVTNFQILAVP